jgi:hypothetical protein
MSDNLTGSPGIIESVYEGMHVVDAVGHSLGKVTYVQMGDPDAVTTKGNRPRETGLLGDLARAFNPDARPEPEVEEPLWSELTRVGFVKVDGPGLFSADRYIRADWLAGVDGDTVYVAAPANELPKEH